MIDLARLVERYYWEGLPYRLALALVEALRTGPGGMN